MVSGSWPKNSPTVRRITGMRVEPPTITTPLTSSLVMRASRRTLRTAVMVRTVSAVVQVSNWARVTDCVSVRPPIRVLNCTTSWLESASLQRRACACSAARSDGVRSSAITPCCASTQAASAWS
ncbi:hypothetical protein D9M68_822290 [compost metagenome]